ncbi:hypothetical protein [Kitasatospora sp. NPDC051914]|uniref:hypothetical protein n=1 Tax=Kitasatospora sp. NPDC051914 TaxID=3154945 RepID=UPI0034301938
MAESTPAVSVTGRSLAWLTHTHASGSVHVTVVADRWGTTDLVAGLGLARPDRPSQVAGQDATRIVARSSFLINNWLEAAILAVNQNG